MPKKCTMCGNLSNTNAQFCEKCGSSSFVEVYEQSNQTSFEGGQSSNNNSPVNPVAASDNNQKKKSKNKTAIIVGLSVLLVGLVAIIVFLLFSEKENPDTSKNDETTSISTTEAPSENVNGGENNNITGNAPADSTVTMSDDLYDFTFELEGDVYKLPCDYKDFTDNGWTISSSGYSGDTTISGNSSDCYYMSRDGLKVMVFSYNFSGNVKKIKDCKIGGIECYAYEGVDFVIAKGITVESSVDEIKSAFGTPGYSSSGSDYEVLTYYAERDSYQNCVDFYCSDEADYCSIQLKNFVESDDDETTTSTETPDYLGEYKAPTSMGSDIKSSVVKIEGDLYQLPAPVSVFLDNGWEIVQQSGDVVAGGSDYIYVEKNGKEIELYITNYSDYQTTVENCAVYKVDVDNYENVDISIGSASDSVSIGTKKADVVALVGDEFDYYNGTYNQTYSYSEYSSRDFMVSIDVDKESGKVSGISVSCRTWDY
ncbi:MAG: hypothetical protein E7536_00065 [Ruminococcaceae bacterium]|nr:hypothetical protein [Oscillospiraceae bacterium]